MNGIRFTTRAKVIAGILSGFAFALLVVSVWSSDAGAQCELSLTKGSSTFCFDELPNGEYPYTWKATN